ncbi:hypothetical protein [Desulforegula conservatrix]|uniref:hypothetical protein n=1 Tax=Desulforegula conservatrix TaxID=153026 RepID=UPI00047F6EDC|nr:hypothetical protein [Desulforegula conservatrix]
MTVSLSHNLRAKAYAAYDGNLLVVTHISPITGLFALWEKPLMEEISDKIKKGYTVLVDEPMDRISRAATRIDLNATVDGRSNFFRVMDAYFSMAATESIILDDEIQKYAIKTGGEGQKIETGHDDKGRVTYHADWQKITGGHRAVMLCAYPMMFEPVDEIYLMAMYGAMETTAPVKNELQRFIESMQACDEKRAIAFENKLMERNK